MIKPTRFSKIIVLLTMLGCVLLANRHVYAFGVSYSESDPTPTGNLVVSRPMIAWRIVPENGCKITEVQLFLNMQPVRAEYDPTQQSVLYMPATALRPGSYAVHCRVTLNSEFKVNKDWNFNIANAALDMVKAPDTKQTALCDAVNAIRQSIFLPLLSVDDRLCAAAAAHTQYLAQNNQVGHEQSAGKAGYFGQTADQRVNAFGYTNSCYEAVSQGSVAATAVRALFDAPYHRAPFLQPGAFQIGAGTTSDIVTLLFEATPRKGEVVYPVNGQKNVPIAWDANESPSPLRFHRASTVTSPTGYVISLFNFGAEDSRLTILSVSLKTPDGKTVAIWVNTPINDTFLENGVLIIPQKPLQPGVSYRAAVEAVDTTGADCSRIWTFTTTAAPQLSSLK